MKWPLGCCVIVTGLMACCSYQAAAQEIQGDGAYTMADPFGYGEPESGFRFQADALIWARSTPGNGGPIIGGPQSFSFSSLPDGNYVGGYRLGAAWLIDPNYEVEGVWTWLSDWTGSSGGILTRSIAFNGGITSPLVDPSGNANFINTGTFFRPIFDAAMDPLANPVIQNFAFLNGGSTYALYSDASLHDFQANFKSRWGECRRFGFGIGYRNIQFDEGTTALITGTFGTNDIPGGGNDFNILTNEALVAHGLVPIAGAADGWTNNAAGPPTFLSLLWNGTTTNRLNGIQATMDGALAQWGNFSLEGLIRAGVFYNQITGSVHEIYAGSGADDSVYGRTFSDEDDVVSFAGNFGLNGLFQINNNWRFRVGYELMVLTNTAVSGDQQSGLTYNGLGQPSYTVQGGSTAVFHGLRTGFELTW